MHWDVEHDTFSTGVQDFAAPGEATKRSVLRDAGCIFDSLGLIVPVTI